MEVPGEVLEKLQCHTCEAYLSCAPIYLKEDATSLCGRCAAPDDGFTRNTPYEAVAQLILFPCKYQKYGCTQLVKCVDYKDHEEECEHRIYICPHLPSGTCEWSGKRCDLLEHFQREHTELVASNPLVLTHDITRPSLQTFIMSAFKVLFLLYTKVCTDMNTIYHSVQVFGPASLASSFLVQLDIAREDCKFTKRKDVTSHDWLALQEPTSLATSITSLLGIIGELEGTTFTLTVRAKCVECGFAVIGEHCYDKGWLCTMCTLVKRPCQFQSKGCTYEDIKYKTRNHEEYFCQYATYCRICSKDIAVTLDEHYTRDHADITQYSDLSMDATFEKWYIVNTEFGKILVFFHSDVDNMLSVKIRTPLHSDELLKCMCEVEFNGNREILGIRINGMDDWCGRIVYGTEKFYIKISVTKKINQFVYN